MKYEITDEEVAKEPVADMDQILLTLLKKKKAPILGTFSLSLDTKNYQWTRNYDHRIQCHVFTAKKK